MKSIINKEEEKKEEIKYPCLMEYKTSSANYVVLFSGRNEGTVIWNINPSHEYGVGDFSSQFIGSKFTPFKGTITLSND